MRQIVLDTETTGLDVGQGHRIIEIGCIEMLNRRQTGRHFHRYLNPDRDIDAGAQAVHGISRTQLEREPRFAEIAAELLEFIDGAELIIHNAPFDVGFLDAELLLLPGDRRTVGAMCAVLDTLALARAMHPGQRNSLDALCKRYQVDNSRRELHGALLDARILADVYLAMTGGQSSLALAEVSVPVGETGHGRLRTGRSTAALKVISVADAELAAHEKMLDLIAKSSGGDCVWRSGS
ncbi:MAG: DNA polymerase III subunit epsilon [Steroidobacteraceae bacterium]